MTDLLIDSFDDWHILELFNFVNTWISGYYSYMIVTNSLSFQKSSTEAPVQPSVPEKKPVCDFFF